MKRHLWAASATTTRCVVRSRRSLIIQLRANELNQAGVASQTEVFDVISQKRTRATSAIQRTSESRRSCAELGLGRLEQLRSIKRPKTRKSCEVLNDFSTFYRAPDAMKD
jgi:hypothetical protein